MHASWLRRSTRILVLLPTPCSAGSENSAWVSSGAAAPSNGVDDSASQLRDESPARPPCMWASASASTWQPVGWGMAQDVEVSNSASVDGSKLDVGCGAESTQPCISMHAAAHADVATSGPWELLHAGAKEEGSRLSSSRTASYACVSCMWAGGCSSGRVVAITAACVTFGISREDLHTWAFASNLSVSHEAFSISVSNRFWSGLTVPGTQNASLLLRGSEST